MSVLRCGLIAVVGVIGVIMLLNAALWVFAPARAAEAIRMPLLTGDALSTQMDIAAFFLGNSIFILLALLSRRTEWFLAPCILLFGAAAFRFLAWLLHGANLLGDMIAFELGMGVVLLIASRTLASKAS